jgi:hypothetical protein
MNPKDLYNLQGDHHGYMYLPKTDHAALHDGLTKATTMPAWRCFFQGS